MQAGSTNHVEYLREEQLIWEVEISDLGACRPFLGFSLTNQYVLVGITSPDQQNEVTITSIPNDEKQEIVIPLSLQKFEFPITGYLTFNGIKRLSEQWRIRLINTKTGRSIPVRQNSKLSLRGLRSDLSDEQILNSSLINELFSLQMIKK